MSLSVHVLKNYPENDTCGYCRENLKVNDPVTGLFKKVVGHTKGGDKHPMHKDCLKEIFQINKTFDCPTCRQTLSPGPLFSTKEKVVAYAHYLLNNRNYILKQTGLIGLGTILGSIPGFSSLYWANELCAGFTPPALVLTAFATSTLALVGSQLPDNLEDVQGMINVRHIRKVMGYTVVSSFIIAHLVDKLLLKPYCEFLQENFNNMEAFIVPELMH